MDDSAIVELFWKRDEQAIAATTEKYNVYCWLFRGNGGLKTSTTPVFIPIRRHSTFG